MALNLRQIEVFRAVMLTGTVSAAARLLNVSAPAVSRLLAHTETTVGMALFKRIKGRLHATPEARRLYAEVEHAYVGIQRVNTLARELLENRQGRLRIASHATIGGSRVPRAIGELQRTHENIGILYECVRQWELTERLINQQADLAITLFPMEHPNLESIHLCDVPLVCIFPKKHPLAGKPRITASEISRHPIVGYEQGTPFGIELDELFAKERHPAQIRLQAGTPYETCTLIREGIDACGIVDWYSAQDLAYGHRTLAVAPIEGARPLRARVVYRRQEPMSRLALAFVELMRKHAAVD